MPSSLTHEIDKLRGRMVTTGKIYTESISIIKDSVDSLIESIETLQSKDDSITSKINKVDTLSKKAYHTAKEEHGHNRQKNRTRKEFITSFYYTTGDPDEWGINLDPNANELIYYRFMMPDDFEQLNYIAVLYTTSDIDTVNHEWVLDSHLYFGATDLSDRLDPVHGYASAYFGGQDNNAAITIPHHDAQKNWTYKLDYTPDGGIPITALNKNDVCWLNITRDAVNALDNFTKDIAILGLIIDYESDM